MTMIPKTSIRLYSLAITWGAQLNCTPMPFPSIFFITSDGRHSPPQAHIICNWPRPQQNTWTHSQSRLPRELWLNYQRSQFQVERSPNRGVGLLRGGWLYRIDPFIILVVLNLLFWMCKYTSASREKNLQCHMPCTWSLVQDSGFEPQIIADLRSVFGSLAGQTYGGASGGLQKLLKTSKNSITVIGLVLPWRSVYISNVKPHHSDLSDLIKLLSLCLRMR